jgi:uncharacterized membrane-anchored protein
MLKYKIFLTLYTVLLITIFFASFKYKIPNSVLILVICLSVYVAFHNDEVGFGAFNFLRYKINKRMSDVVWWILFVCSSLLMYGIGDYLKESKGLISIQFIMLLVIEEVVADMVFAFFVKYDPKN